MERKIFAGAQGWNYDDWTTKAGGEPVFYPRGTKSGEMLAAYSELFDTVEVDSTFYAIPQASVIESWYRKTPRNFTFALKLPREITHDRYLKPDSYEAADAFCERALELKEKLAAVLVQLPPQFEASKENAVSLRNFLSRLPREIRFSVEFRSRDWMVDWTFDELSRNGASLCLVEGGWIPRELMFDAIGKIESDFAYVRFMGERDLTRFDRVYRDQGGNLAVWKEQIERIESREIFVYFSNFYEGHSPASVNKLKEMLGQETADPGKLEDQPTLF